MRNYRIEDERITLLEGDKILAEIDFPKVLPHVHAITHTFVDESLRGQGIANELIGLLLRKARKDDFLLDPVCSFAVNYFEKHPEVKFLRFENK